MLRINFITRYQPEALRVFEHEALTVWDWVW